MFNKFRLLLAIIVAIAVSPAQAFELQWFGQAAFKLTTENGKVIVIDPFILKNPKTPTELKDLKAIGKVDLILVTHGHFDHTADVQELARLTGAKVGMNADMGSVYSNLGILPKDKLVRWNKSGTVTPIGDDIKITMLRAEHSSTVTHEGHVHAGGEPVGYVIELENGFKIYHSGDTGVFGDMKMIGDYYKPDLALVCIGGWFTMGPLETADPAPPLLRLAVGFYPHLGGLYFFLVLTRFIIYLIYCCINISKLAMYYILELNELVLHFLKIADSIVLRT